MPAAKAKPRVKPKAKPAAKVPAKPKAAKRVQTIKPKAPRRPPSSNVVAAVEKLLDSIELDDFGQARAAIARTLAAKFDKAAEPGTAKELRELIDAFQEASDDSQEFVSGLFASVGDSAST